MADSDEEVPQFRDAEAWLAEQGIERRSIEIAGDDDDGGREPSRDTDGQPPRAPHPAGPGAERGGAGESSRPAGGESDDDAPGRAEADDVDRDGDEPVESAEAADEPRRRLEDEVSAAVATARRSTAQAPKSEQKLAERLAAKGYSQVVVDLAMERCREQSIVNDEAYAQLFVDERSRKGHGPFRIRRDLEQRGLPERIIDEAVAGLEEQDQEARAFDLAQDKARRSTGVDAETAYRRTVSYVARRGYPEALARKVARQAVFAEREEERTSSR